MFMRIRILAVMMGMVWGSSIMSGLMAAGLPLVTSNPASSVSNSSAQLNGTWGPNGATTAIGFDVGTTTNYAQRFYFSTINAAVVSLSAGSSVSGLVGGQTYHYRAVGSNS